MLYSTFALSSCVPWYYIPLFFPDHTISIMRQARTVPCRIPCRMSHCVEDKETRRHPPCAAVSLKRDDFNTPSEILFFEKENGGFDFISKPPFGYVILFWAKLFSRRNNGFFISVGAVGMLLFCFYPGTSGQFGPMLLHLLVLRLTTQYAYFLRLGD